MDDTASRNSSVAASTKTGYKSIRNIHNAHHATASAAEVRDLQSLHDKLRKEMDRKEAKLQSLSKELQATRASQQDHQKELRLVTGSLELVQSEKATLLLEYNKVKKQFDELRKKHVHLSDALKLSSQMEQLQEENERYFKQQQSLQAEIELRDKRVQTLQYELDVAHKALNVQNRYEGTNNNNSSSLTSLPGSLGSNRELLRSLYFDLGKAAADNHAMSLSLANSEQAQQTLEITVKSVREENTHYKTRIEELELIVEARDKSIRDQNILISCLHEQVSELDEKFALKSKAMDMVLLERDEVKEKYLNLDREYSRLNSNLTQVTNELQEKLAQLTSLQTQTLDFQTRMDHEKDVLLEEITRLRHVEEDFLKTRDKVSSITESLNTEKRRYQDLQQQYLEMKASVHLHAHQQQTLSELVQVKEQSLQSLQHEQLQNISERDTLATALTKAMQLVRQLQEQCEQEKKSRIVAEQELQETMRIKEEMTQAVVQALHDERQKAHDLASALQSLRMSASIAPPPPPPRAPLTPTTTSVTVTSTLQPPHSSNDFQWLRRDAQIDQQVQQMYTQPHPHPTSTALSAPSYDVTHAMSNPHFAAALQRVSAPASNNNTLQNNNNYNSNYNYYNANTHNSNPNAANGINNSTMSILPPNTSVVFRDSILNDLNRLNDEIRSILPTPQSQSNSAVVYQQRQPLQPEDITNNSPFYNNNNNISNNSHYQYSSQLPQNTSQNVSASYAAFPQNVSPDWDALASTLRASTPDASHEAKHQ